MTKDGRWMLGRRGSDGRQENEVLGGDCGSTTTTGERQLLLGQRRGRGCVKRSKLGKGSSRACVGFATEVYLQKRKAG